MKKNNILKEASVFLIILLIVSSVMVTANTNINNNYFAEGNNSEDIVWDNFMNYNNWITSVVDEVNGIDVGVADDLMFTEDTEALDVHWIGGYSGTGYQSAAFDWVIGFFYDQGDGNAPGELIFGLPFSHGQCNPVVIEDTGTRIYYEFSVTMPGTLYFEADTKYWIEIFGFGETPPFSFWAMHDDPILLHQAVYGSNSAGIPYWTDISEFNGIPYDMCFQLLAAPHPDLNCEGSLSWTDVEPGTKVTGSFEIENIGDPGTLLDWEVTDYPTWGTWIFEPDEGEDLTPEDGAITIEVTAYAPDVQEEKFEGEVTITNSEDSGDFCIIDVSLTTPKNKPIVFNFLLLNWLFDRFPNAFLILRYLVGQ